MDNGSASVPPTNAKDPPTAALSPLANAIAGLQSPALQVLQSIKQAIWGKRPVLEELMKTHKDETLHAYTRGLYNVKPIERLDARKTELFDVVRDLVTKRLGAEVGDATVRQLKKLPMVSTADHHAFIQHPFWVNSNLISGLPIWESTDPDLKYLIAFSFANVSMNNASAFSRGLLFHGGVNGSGNLVRMPIFPDKAKMATVWGHRKFTSEDLARLKQAILQKVREGVIVAERAEQINDLVDEFLGTADVLSADDLNAQITKVNFALWPRLFHHMDPETSPPETHVPGLLYLEIETIVSELLTRHHLEHAESLIHKLLFDSQYQTLTKQHFDSIPGSFCEAQGWGTFHFWGLDANGKRIGLKLNDGQLHSADGTFSVPFTPDDVKEGLEKKTLMPAMSLCYVMIALHYGLACLGGFCQIHDLTLFKRAYEQILAAKGENEEVTAIEQVDTKKFGGDGLVIAYFRSVQGGIVPATGLDMAVEHVRTLYADYAAFSKTITFEEAMNPLVPEMYTVLFSNDQRDPRLLQITPEQILRDTGLQAKLESAVTAMEAGKAPVMA